MAILFGLGVMLSSCNTTPSVLTDEAKVAAIASVLRSGTQIAVSATVGSKPESKPYFDAVVTGLKVALGGKDLTPEAVVATIAQHVKSFDSEGAYAGVVLGAVDLALNAYKTFYNVNVEKSIQPYLVTLLTAIKDGVKLGAVSTTPAPMGANPISALTVKDLTL